MFDLAGRAERHKLVLARRGPLSQTKKPIAKLLTVASQHRADAYRTGAFKVPQKSPGVCGCLGLEDPDEDPSRVARSMATNR